MTKEFFTKKEISQILADLDLLDHEKPIDFSDIDYDSIEKCLRNGPASKYLPPVNPEFQKYLPPLDQDGGIDIEIEGQSVHVPSAYLPMVNFSFYNFSITSETAPMSSSTFELIGKHIKKFIEWVFQIKKTAKKQMRDILENADTVHQELCIRMKQMATEYQDSSFEVLMLLPDLIVYLCHLLADKEVSKEYKNILAVTLVYVVSPIDLIPEAIIQHPIAYSDDLALVLLVVKMGIDGKYVTKAQVKKHWPGDMDLLENIQDWYAAAEDILGSVFITKIFNYLGVKLGFS